MKPLETIGTGFDAVPVRTLRLRLDQVVLCLDCETCFEIGSDPCPACGSGMWASVARFLNRRNET